MYIDQAKLDRYLLLAYLTALFGLLVLPVSEPKFYFLGIKSDKWFHVALFAGLALLLRWNLVGRSRPSEISILVTTTIAFLIEVVQAMIYYRSAEWYDLVAGFFGAIIGVAVMRQILKSSRPGKMAGILVTILGAMILVASVLADLIRYGSHIDFGPRQALGAVLGLLILVGGLVIFIKGLPGLESADSART